MTYTAGISVPAGRTVVREWLRGVHVTAAVDFGTGEGSMGILLRRALGKRVELTGCDVWPPAVRLCNRLPGVYDNVERADVRTYAERCASGRGVLWSFGDVLEHMPMRDAHALIQRSRAEWLLVRIPVGPWPQTDLPNPAEEHLWTFYPSLLRILGKGYRRVHMHITARRPGFPEFRDLRFRRLYRERWLYIASFLLHRIHPAIEVRADAC